ncbi:DUF72 domain-containing protein [Methylibium sp.]|uniref:DUF72 domain-containing protein n=1 Tax=Methylibium sp. TaxID=2067992 RepID=UPI003D0AACED
MSSSHPDLFGEEEASAPDATRRGRRSTAPVQAAEVAGPLKRLAVDLGPLVRFGTSSWYFPGWEGLVFRGRHSESTLSRHGLAAYAQHPLLRTVSLDRSFYRPLPAASYAALAAQVPDDFRFVVKATAAVTDASVRQPGSGAPGQPNPLFLDPATTLETVLRPAVDGLGHKLGVLLFQLSPLPTGWLLSPPERLPQALDRLFTALARSDRGPGLLAIELRDPELLTPELAALLKSHGVRYCVGLHDRMPPLDAQLPMLRATWPGPLVCRWSLQRGLRYQQAKARFEPFGALAAPDPATREALARLIAATVRAGQPVFATINNKAEGSAPLSVLALAEAVAALAQL